jgi:hypothetical protein
VRVRGDLVDIVADHRAGTLLCSVGSRPRCCLSQHAIRAPRACRGAQRENSLNYQTYALKESPFGNVRRFREYEFWAKWDLFVHPLSVPLQSLHRPPNMSHVTREAIPEKSRLDLRDGGLHICVSQKLCHTLFARFGLGAPYQ